MAKQSVSEILIVRSVEVGKRVEGMTSYYQTYRQSAGTVQQVALGEKPDQRIVTTEYGRFPVRLAPKRGWA
jgi:sugar diacid utilization regulator